jgi:pyruvate carboxylase
VTSTVKSAERADPSNAGHVAAPFGGVVTVKVKAGDTVAAGDPIATIEAMKMEATISAPVAGTVDRLAIGEQGQVEGGDLLIVLA